MLEIGKDEREPAMLRAFVAMDKYSAYVNDAHVIFVRT